MSEERKAISLIKTKDKETAVDNKNARIKYPIYDREVSQRDLKEDKMPVDFKSETPVNSKPVKYNESSLNSYYKHYNRGEVLKPNSKVSSKSIRRKYILPIASTVLLILISMLLSSIHYESYFQYPILVLLKFIEVLIKLTIKLSWILIVLQCISDGFKIFITSFKNLYNKKE